MIHNTTQLEAHRLASTSTSSPVLLCAADDNYAKPLTVTLHSAASHLRAGSVLTVLLMDGGISESNWMAIKESLAGLPLDIHVLQPDPTRLRDLGISHHITHTAYFRLLAAELLPDTLDKVIYLDSDVLVRDDLTQLWEMELGDHYCLAVQDIACPFVDARLAGANRKRSNPYMASLSPIRNWRQLGIQGNAPYFNSGVMVLNLKRWRDDHIGEKLLDCLRQNQAFVWCWDQYALNVVFAGQWGQLPLRWNQGAHVFEYPSEQFSPVDAQQFVQMRDNPAIIHFTTEWKPWDYRPYHPLRNDFLDYLDQTAWRGWRPEKPQFNLYEEWNQLAAGFCRRWIIGYRKIRNAIGLA